MHIDDAAGTLAERLADLGLTLLETLPCLAAGAVQQTHRYTRSPRARVDTSARAWTEDDAGTVRGRIRAFDPRRGRLES